MGLLKFIEKDVSSPDFGDIQYRRDYKQRPHISKLEMDDDQVRYLRPGDLQMLKADSTGTSYLTATDLIFDMLMSVYDANTHTLVAYRFTSFDPNVKKRIAALFAKAGVIRNYEVRLFGLQNGQKTSSINDVIYFAKGIGAEIFEIDLFGDSVRNICLDAKRGMSYDILMLDRAYKPGELINSTTKEQFERSLMGLKQ